MEGSSVDEDKAGENAEESAHNAYQCRTVMVGEGRPEQLRQRPGARGVSGAGTGELVYCHKLLQPTVPGFVHPLRRCRNPRWNCNAKLALRPDSSVVERGPEKAGVGGSIPSLATTLNSST